MRVTMRIFYGTQDTGAAVDQTVEAFGAALARDCENSAPFAHVGEICFVSAVAHPIMPPQTKGWASFDRGAGVFFTDTILDYHAWIGDRWLARVAAVAAAAQKALTAVHKTRITPAERQAVAEAIDRTAATVAASPPDKLAALGPVYAQKDRSGNRLGIGFQPPIGGEALAAFGITIDEVHPADLAAYLAEAAHDAPEEASVPTIKLYKRIEGRLHYREVWSDGDKVIAHVGLCGERGEIVEHPAAGIAAQREAVERITSIARKAGFKTIPHSRMAGLLVSAPIDGMGGVDDLDRRHALEDFLNEVTGWTGLGHCDGGSIGSGSMEALCPVVDYEVAAEVIGRELANSPFADFTVSRQPR